MEWKVEIRESFRNFVKIKSECERIESLEEAALKKDILDGGDPKISLVSAIHEILFSFIQAFLATNLFCSSQRISVVYKLGNESRIHSALAKFPTIFLATQGKAKEQQNERKSSSKKKLFASNSFQPSSRFRSLERELLSRYAKARERRHERYF